MTINYRKDRRTTEQFKTDISNRTSKERFLAKLFRKKYSEMGHKVELYNNGTDNSGKLQERVSCDGDYRIVIDGHSAIYDIKASPVIHKCTFKVHNLKQYIKNKTNILLFYNTGKIDKPPHDNINKHAKCVIISGPNIEKMLNENEEYEEWLFGNKLCIKIGESQYDDYFTPLF